VELYHPGPGQGARRTWWDIFPGTVVVLGYGVDRGPCRHRGFQRGPLGDLIGVGRHLVALPRV
jgi:hypothetical protein